MFRVCGEKHAPRKCDAFKKLSPQQRLKELKAGSSVSFATGTCKDGSAGQRTKCPTAEWMAVKRLTTISCTAHSWRAA
jgi:hypothetical protein